MNPLAIVFLKAPRVGFVKTRLGRETGCEKATEIYRQLAEGQIRRMPRELSREIHYTPEDAGGEMSAWLGAGEAYRPQASGDLGARLRHATADALARGFDRVVVLGADCPALDARVLERAFAWLDTTDVVLGPAEDGGYYLVGIRRPMPRLFEDIAWGTSTVLATTLDRVRELGLACASLPVLADIDTADDWRRHLAKGPSVGVETPPCIQEKDTA